MRVAAVVIGSALVSILLWGLFTRRWSGQARAARARARGSAPSNPLLAIPVPWVFVLAFLAGLGIELLAPLRLPSEHARSLVWWIGLVPVAAGLAIAFSALRLFRKSGTTTVPFETPSRFVKSGPYRFTRNPMYVGLSLLYVGIAATQGQMWPVLLLPLVIVYVDRVVIPVEERRLQEVFGEEYARYRGEIRRWV